MKLKPETVMEKTNPAFLGKRQQHMFCKASTTLQFTPKSENEKAGLMIFQGEFNFYFMCKSIKENKTVIQLFKGDKKAGNMILITELPLSNPSAAIQLEIEAKGGLYDFKYKQGNESWLTLKNDVDGKYLSTQAAGGFIGSLFALYATSSGQQSNNTASFKWLDYSGNDKIYHSK